MRLLSLAPSCTEILYALGLGDQIVGTTTYCDYPPDAQKKPKVGSWIISQPEKIKALKPDLIFTSYFLPEQLLRWSGPGEIIHVVPRTLDDVQESFKIIGRVTKKYRRALKLIQRFNNQLEKILLSQPTTRPKVYMEEWPSPPMVSGNWIPEIVEIAGGIPIIAKKGLPSCEFDFKQLKREDPDVLIFHWCGFGDRWNKSIIINRNGWKNLKAVQKNTLFVINDSLLNRPSPRLVLGAQKLQQILANL